MVEFRAPGPGRWNLEVSHFHGVFTPFFRDTYKEASEAGLAASMARYGLPVKKMAIEFLNDRPYTRITPLIEPPRRLASRQPPKWLLKIVSRIHPGLRRCTRTAQRMLETKGWRADCDRWEREQKPAFIQRNLALQDEDVAAMDDTQLADHLRRALANARDGVFLHFDLVAPDSVPLGMFLMRAQQAGIEPHQALGFLQGASPASAETTRWLAAGDVDSYLRHFGHRVVTNYDVDGKTLNELPQMLDASVRAATAATREQRTVPSTGDAELDALLDEARLTYGVRDDNSGITLQWPIGLVRRALLEAGRRLVAAHRLHHPEHIFELKPDEVTSLLTGQDRPTADDAQARAASRAAHNAAPAPRTLGPEEPLPPVDAMPGPLAQIGGGMVIQAELMYSAEGKGELAGTGVGTEAVTGRARTAATPEEALERLEPGDVLIAFATTPAYNAVLPILSGLVVEEGGALSHAAIVAREFGISAVIGAAGAMARIPDGAAVEVDPAAGRVRVLAG